MVCSALQYFSTFVHERHYFGEKKELWNTKCVFWLSLKSVYEVVLTLRRIQRDVIKKMCIGLRVKYLLFFADLN